jgi:hypothetical protein
MTPGLRLQHASPTANLSGFIPSQRAKRPLKKAMTNDVRVKDPPGAEFALRRRQFILAQYFAAILRRERLAERPNRHWTSTHYLHRKK